MFHHELADPPVSACEFSRSSSSSYPSPANASRRFAAYLYTPEGKVVTQRCWDETMAELEFADVRTILNSMRK